MTKSEVTQAIAKRLRAARQGREMSQPEFGRLIGMSKQCISAWENGKAQLSALQIIECAKVLGVDSSWLLSGDQQRGWAPSGGQSAVPLLAQGKLSDVVAGQLDLGKGQIDALNHFKLSSRCFAFEIVDDSMSPILEEKDVVIVDPGMQTRQGDVVVAAVAAAGDASTTTVIVRQVSFLVRDNSTPLILAPASPDYTVTRIDSTGNGCVLGPVVALIRGLPRLERRP